MTSRESRFHTVLPRRSADCEPSERLSLADNVDQICRDWRADFVHRQRAV